MTDLTDRTVMVVEDLFYLAMDAKQALREAGATVIGPFATSEAALESLNQETPNAAVLDVNLGEGASFAIARALLAKNIPFLFFTGYDASAIPAEFSRIPRLEKPVAAGRLVEMVRASIDSVV